MNKENNPEGLQEIVDRTQKRIDETLLDIRKSLNNNKPTDQTLESTPSQENQKPNKPSTPPLPKKKPAGNMPKESIHMIFLQKAIKV